MADKLVRIYSNEHGAYWKADYCGYTEDVKLAGVFSYDDVTKEYPNIGYDEEAEDYLVDIDIDEIKYTLQDIHSYMSKLVKQEFRLVAIIKEGNEDD